MSEYLRINDTLQALLQQAKPAKRKKALKEAGKYLAKKDRKNITKQQNPDGTQWKPRKDKHSGKRGLTVIEYLGNFAKNQHGGKTKVKTLVGKVVKETRKYITLEQHLGDGESRYRNLSKKNIVARYAYKRKNRKMLLGMRRFIRSRVMSDNYAEVSLKPRLATIHHYGQSVDGIEMPERQLLGFSDENVEAIFDIFINVMFAQ